MTTWPATLPQRFERRGFRTDLPDQIVRSTIRGGEVKRRRLARRSESAPLNGQMLVTTAQWNTLLAFYRDDLRTGVLRFDFPDPDDADATIKVAFTEPPSMSAVGGDLHRARLQFERQ